ncbi:hypothetical protein HHK36_004332 [Tetracentron sinense]|uniref:Magnesium transporter n=1 Tax=Tetracentron sinense TaxID=13715 RepID=A0A834ZV25_TETSI|nr:hypothetical protein HHK36_004332 [Tetracentron sinense]
MAPVPATPPRRKGAGTRTWLVVSCAGKSYLEEVGKHPIMRRTGLPARDLRILDPGLSYPSSILGREKAIVVNLEHIKAIVTATEVLVLNSKDPSVVPFVRDLECRVSNFNSSPPPATGGNDPAMEDKHKAIGDSPLFPASQESSQLFRNSSNPDMMLENDTVLRASLDVPKGAGPKVLPFEFKALEVCLEFACRCLESETSTLEQEAYPASDELTSKISTLNLQHVRNIKSRLVGLFGRVQKVRDELENLLDDDMDMAEMYLTDKLARQQFEDDGLKDELENDAFEFDDELILEGFGAQIPSVHESPLEENLDHKVSLVFGIAGPSGRPARRAISSVVERAHDNCVVVPGLDEDVKSNKSSTGDVTGFKPNIEELEMLLEAYFPQIEGTLNKLSAMREYVDDTEDYVNIMLDDKQNQLLQMGVVLSTATLLLSCGIVIAGILGMNIHIELFNRGQAQFLETTSGIVGGFVVLYFIALRWYKRRGLLE